MDQPSSASASLALLLLLALLAGCVEEPPMWAEKAESLRPRDESAVTRHQVGDSVTIGSDSPGYESPHVRFTMEGIDEVSENIRVRLRAVSAQEGRIAYLRTQHYRLSGSIPASPGVTVHVNERGDWEPGLAVCDKERRNLPAITMRLTDNYANAYELAAVEPSQPFFQTLYPGETKAITVAFRGPIVAQAKSLTFELRHSHNKIHQWQKSR